MLPNSLKGLNVHSVAGVLDLHMCWLDAEKRKVTEKLHSSSNGSCQLIRIQ